MGDKDEIKCPNCGRKCKQRGLVKHLQKCDRFYKEPVWIRCAHENCGYETKSKPDLLQHYRTCHGSR